MKITEARARTACSPSRLPGLDFALNPYRGCGHGCIYCYSPDVLRLKNWEEWGSFVEVRRNIPVLLSKEKKKLQGVVGLGTVTDPYQPIEDETFLTRYCLEQLALGQCRICIQTKSDLILRDIDLLERMDVEVGFTINTMDEIIASKIEPGAPSPEKRLDALGRLSGAGIETWVFLGPIIPLINDSEDLLKSVIKGAKESGAGKLMYDKLRLKPYLQKRLEKLFGYSKAQKVFRLARDKEWEERVTIDIEILCEDFDLPFERAF